MACLPQKLMAVVLGVVCLGMAATANDTEPDSGVFEAPVLSDKRDYSEYWEQQFLFDNDTIATSQFLIANLPFSKHHGMQVASLKESGKEPVIIKNGRKRSGWDHSPQKPHLRIFQHELSSEGTDFSLKLHNTAAELDVEYSSKTVALPIVEAGNSLGLPSVTLYAPSASAIARWRDGPEIGGPGPEGSWRDIGSGFGYGLHVVQHDIPNKTLQRWYRMTGAPGQAATPVLHVFETPNGESYMKFALLEEGGVISSFDVSSFEDTGRGTWKLKAVNGKRSVTGTIEVSSKLETFKLADQLNSLEALAAGSMADVNRDRYAANYALTLKSSSGSVELSGRALAEDVQLGKVKEKRRRKRR